MLTRPGSPAGDRAPLVNTERSMPAEKCRPVDERTMTRTSPRALRLRTIAGHSSQKAAVIVLSSSGRDIWTWATLPVISTVKQVCMRVIVGSRGLLGAGRGAERHDERQLIDAGAVGSHEPHAERELLIRRGDEVDGLEVGLMGGHPRQLET